MWKSKFMKFAYGINSSINAIGVGNIKLVRGFKQRAKRLMIRLLARDNLISIEVCGLPMYIYANTEDTIAYVVRPFEPYTTELFEKTIKPGYKVLDIGAQFGYYSLIAAKKAGQNGGVYAFEPAPANYHLLNRNIQMNKYTDIVHALNKGVGDKHKTETLYLYESTDSHGMFRKPSATIKESISIECVTIDEFLGNLPVDVIKMDIEGNEPYALEGMRQTISKNNSIILFIEFAPTLLNRAGVKSEDFLKQLRDLGLDLQLIDEHSRCLKPITEDFLARIDKDWYANLYCTKIKSQFSTH